MTPAPPFRPPFWLRNGHANTVYSFLRPRGIRLPEAQADWIPAAPGVDILVRSHWQPRPAPALVLVHGLEGHSEAGYMLTTTALALARGWHVLRMNVRGCGESEPRCETLYNSGKSGDVAAVLAWAASRPMVTGTAMGGFSMGGNLVLKCAAELAPEARPAAVVAVSPCLDLAACAVALHRKVNYFYEQRFLRSLKERLLRHATRFPGRYPVEKLEAMRSVREFDDAVTAPFTGYRDADDYYARASASGFLDRIGTPTLVLHAEDDPFIVITPASRARLAANRWIQFEVLPHGGHCAFIDRRQHGHGVYWAEARLVDYCVENGG